MSEPPLSPRTFLAPADASPPHPPDLEVGTEPRRPTRTQALCLFLFVLLGFQFGAYLVIWFLRLFFKLNNNWVMPINDLAQVLFIAVPSLLFCLLFRYDLRSTLSLHPTSWKGMGLSVLVGLSVWLPANFLAVLFNLLLEQLGPVAPQLPSPTNQFQAILYLPSVILVPAICEELLNRGVLQRAFGGHGLRRTVVSIAILFGVFHLGISTIVYTTILGGVLAYVIYQTGSLYNSMIVHATANAVSTVLLVGSYFFSAPKQAISLDKAPAPSSLANSDNTGAGLLGLAILILIPISYQVLRRALRALPLGPHAEAASQPAPQAQQSRRQWLVEVLVTAVVGIVFAVFAAYELHAILYPRG